VSKVHEWLLRHWQWKYTGLGIILEVNVGPHGDYQLCLRLWPFEWNLDAFRSGSAVPLALQVGPIELTVERHGDGA
jgi:hypothetical protein